MEAGVTVMMFLHAFGLLPFEVNVKVFVGLTRNVFPLRPVIVTFVILPVNATEKLLARRHDLTSNDQLHSALPGGGGGTIAQGKICK